ncbi:beta strand repeat-containing protein [Aquisphaera insulae]|uniref:beta strand repeat-containing protein n=1 Tax=Aquisphaera insulae TaxID=2712864 RepID=UPI0013EB7974|nr:choice-of-anchor Q domain-containing protein [Aquisphaera insulae]
MSHRRPGPSDGRHHAGRQARTGTRRRMRPRLEALEDRTLLAVYNVTTFADVVNASDGVLSLREAVNAADVAGGTNSINLPAGTYGLSLGRLDLTKGSITITGGSPSAILQGNGRVGVMYVGQGVTANLDHLTLTNGFSNFGGAGLFNDGTANLSNVVVRNNTAHAAGKAATGTAGARVYGGGINNTNTGTMTLTDSTVTLNTATAGDGADANVDSSLHLIPATSGGTAWGGGILNGGRLSLVRSSVASNFAIGGAGGTTASLIQFLFPSASPQAAGGDGRGGGIGNYVVSGPGVTTLDAASALSANGARGGGGGGNGLGGGLYVDSGTVTINGSLASNQATGGAGSTGIATAGGAGGSGEGGGAFLAAGSLDLSGATVSSNVATGGIGGAGLAGSAGAAGSGRSPIDGSVGNPGAPGTNGGNGGNGGFSGGGGTFQAGGTLTATGGIWSANTAHGGSGGVGGAGGVGGMGTDRLDDPDFGAAGGNGGPGGTGGHGGGGGYTTGGAFAMSNGTATLTGIAFASNSATAGDGAAGGLGGAGGNGGEGGVNTSANYIDVVTQNIPYYTAYDGGRGGGAGAAGDAGAGGEAGGGGLAVGQAPGGSTSLTLAGSSVTNNAAVGGNGGVGGHGGNGGVGGHGGWMHPDQDPENWPIGSDWVQYGGLQANGGVGQGGHGGSGGQGGNGGGGGAGHGGGLYEIGGLVTVTNVTLAANATTGGTGGQDGNGGDGGNGGEATDNAIYTNGDGGNGGNGGNAGNLAGKGGDSQGGAAYVSGGIALLRFVTASTNAVNDAPLVWPQGQGGKGGIGGVTGLYGGQHGLAGSPGSGSIYAGNEGTTDGSAFNTTAANGSVTVTNSILAGNAGAPNDVVGRYSTGGGNVIGPASSPGDFNGQGDLTGVGATGLLPLGNYGGATPTMPPAAGSKALNRGVVLSTVTTDQRGFARTINGMTDSGAVEHQPASSFTISGPTSTVAGVAQTYTVTALDSQGIRSYGYAGTVAITSGDRKAVLPNNFNLTNGLGSFTITLETSGSQSITATESGGSISGSATVVVSPAAFDHLAFGQQPTNAVAGSSIAPTVTVQAVDAYGNVVTAQTGTVTLTLADNPTFAALYNASSALVQGIASFPNLTVDLPSGRYTLAASGIGNSTTTSAAFGVSPALVRRASGPSTVNQGAPYTLKLMATGGTVGSWIINWGDGTTSTVAGTATAASHTYWVAANLGITVSESDSDGTVRAVQYNPRNYASDFQASMPMAGWSYLWNKNGPIGTASNYVPLVWGGNFGGSYTTDATAFPSAGPGGFGILGRSYGHPGTGSGQNGTFDRDVIAGFTVPRGGTYQIIDGVINRNNGAAGGSIELLTYKGNGQLGDRTGIVSATTFGSSPVAMATGDAFYLAVGPEGGDGYDSFGWDFTVVQTDRVPVIVAPVSRSATGPASVVEGRPYSLTLAASGGTLASWTVDWGDGTIATLPATASLASHTFTGAATRTIRVSATDADGTVRPADTLIRDYATDFLAPTPAAGWSYLWNGGGAVGNPANYTAMVANPANTRYQAVTTSYPSSYPAGFVALGANGGHPGGGSGQTPGGYDVAAIAAYTVPAGGTYRLGNGTLTRANGGAGGTIGLAAYSGSTRLLSDPGVAGTIAWGSAPVSLAAGSTLYAAVLPEGSDGYDSFAWDFNVIRVGDFSITVIHANRASSFVVQDGQQQRSLVNTLSLDFDGGAGFSTILSPGRVTLSRLTPGGTPQDVSLAGALTLVGTRLTFNFGAKGLGDGRYVLKVDADGDGVAETVLSFHRLFGDSDGDGDVDATDYKTFLAAYKKPAAYAANWFLDVDADGMISDADFAAFRLRYGTRI